MTSSIAYGVFSSSDNLKPRLGAKINNKVIDLEYIAKYSLISSEFHYMCSCGLLNEFIQTSHEARRNLKAALMDFASIHSSGIYHLDNIHNHMPLKVTSFTDFYASINHATNIGKIFRPDNPLLPNYKYLPIAYNGRANSIVTSGFPLKRPQGQILPAGAKQPVFMPTQKLDFEVELGVVIGKSSTIGESVSIENAAKHIFGLCIVNDWSARDIQAFEYQPLGPFNSKGFLTSISPWIVPIEEFANCKVPLKPQDPKPADYLLMENDYLYDIEFAVYLKTTNLMEPVLISKPNFKTMYWSINQWIAHHTISGTPLSAGDIIASGTISGETEDTLGSLMELTQNGRQPICLPNGETKTFLADNDILTISAYSALDKTLTLGNVSTQILKGQN